MKIGLSTSVIQRGRSGVGQYVLALVRALLDEARQHEFTLFVLEKDLPLFAFAQGTMRLVTVAERYRPPVWNIFWHQRELPRLIRQLRLDVLHVPSYRRLLWPRPCALVATIHDLAPFHLPEKYDRLRMFYGRVAVRRLAQRQDQIIAVSQHTAHDLTAFFDLPPKRVSVIHNGLDHERFFPDSPAEARAVVSLRYGVRQPFFLYIARLEHPAKNHVRLIEAFNYFKAETASPWQLVLGGSDWHGAEKIHAAVRASPFAHDIHRLGFVPAEDLPTWYRAAEVFVFPSLFEGFGLPPLEAMACACPVLASDRGAVGEICGNAAAFINPEDGAQIKRQLIRLATSQNLREQLRGTGLAHAQKFDWRHTAAATLEIYARAVNGAKTSSIA